MPGQADPVLYRVNCGALEPYVDALGYSWEPWHPLSDGAAWGGVGGDGWARERWLQIEGTTSPEVYRTEHVGPNAYVFRVLPGWYGLRLHFAETFECVYRAGLRHFRVSVNDTAILDRFDPYLEAGGWARPVVVEVCGIHVTGEPLTIAFTPQPHGALVNGIELMRSHEEPWRVVTTPSKLAPAVLPADYDDRPALPGARHIVFVGNSHTQFWAIPESVEWMARKQAGVALRCSQQTIGGPSFGVIAKEKRLAELVREHKPDAMVMQAVYGDADVEAAQEIAGLMHGYGGSAYLYQAFARDNHTAEDIARSQAHFADVGRRIGASVVPVGEAWQRVRAARPGLQLIRDGIHGGILGGYITTCTFFSWFTGKSAEGANPPATLVGQASIERGVADFLARQAFEAVKAAKDGA